MTQQKTTVVAWDCGNISNESDKIREKMRVEVRVKEGLWRITDSSEYQDTD